MGEDRNNTVGSNDDRIERIRNGDSKAFEEVFFEYHGKLCAVALRYVRSPELAKDCVQDVFLKIWRRREELEIRHNIRVYLYQAVRNQALNQIEKSKNRQHYSEKFYHEKLFQVADKPADLSTDEWRLVREIWELVEEMPERRRAVFELHRRHGLSYKEIARVMKISRKTVENHMGKALQQIRDQISIEEP
ncbi:MAG: RNA polymerase sigma-70 factor [Balneolaceae bacterium]|nr:RNA polymerase sigma-70 factor [Balneolaceae bacterium]